MRDASRIGLARTEVRPMRSRPSATGVIEDEISGDIAPFAPTARQADPSLSLGNAAEDLDRSIRLGFRPSSTGRGRVESHTGVRLGQGGLELEQQADRTAGSVSETALQTVRSDGPAGCGSRRSRPRDRPPPRQARRLPDKVSTQHVGCLQPARPGPGGQREKLDQEPARAKNAGRGKAMDGSRLHPPGLCRSSVRDEKSEAARGR